jgi:hypothetical protein
VGINSFDACMKSIDARINSIKVRINYAEKFRSAIIQNWRYQYLFEEIFYSVDVCIKWIYDIFK